MKKLLISILILIIIIVTYFGIVRGISFFNIKSVSDIKSASVQLDEEYNEATKLANVTYSNEISDLESVIKQLKINKQEYDNKKLYIADETSLLTTEIKTFKIHYLWTILGNYKTERGIQSLTLDLVSTDIEDVYDLKFTVVGSYTNIIDFIYDIEDDEEFSFEIKDFSLTSEIDSTTKQDNSNDATDENTEEMESEDNEEQTDNVSNGSSDDEASEEETTTQENDGYTIQAKFTVENVGITLD